MKSIKTPKSDVTLTLAGGTEDNHLHAQRILVYDTDLGETEKDARMAFESIWMPDEAEARKLEAGAGVVLRVWAIKTDDGYTQPPVSLGVTDAVLPERELVDKGTVDHAMGLLYGHLREKAVGYIAECRTVEVDADHVLPDAGEFVDLWIKCMKEAVDAKEGVPTSSNGSPAAARAGDDGSADDGSDDPIADDDISGPDFVFGIQAILGKHTTADVDALPDGGIMVRAKYQGVDVMAQGRTRRVVLKRLQTACNDAAKANEHGQKEGD